MSNIRIISLVGLAAVVSLLVVGCGEADTGAPKPMDGITIGFAQTGDESVWREALTKSMKSEAKLRGVNMKFSDGQNKAEIQVKAIRSFISQEVDAIVLSPKIKTGWETVLKEARDAKIPVILLDRTIEVEDKSLYTCYIGPDSIDEGRKAGRWLVKTVTDPEYVKKHPGDVRVVELQGSPGSAPAADRQTGFAEIIKDCPKIKIVASQTGDFRRSEGKQVMEAFLKSHPDGIDVVFAHNDDMAIGAILAIEEAGKKPGDEILVVSIDAIHDAFTAMVEGTLNCTVECKPILGPATFDALDRLLLKKEKLPKTIRVVGEVFTRETAAEDIKKRTDY